MVGGSKGSKHRYCRACRALCKNILCNEEQTMATTIINPPRGKAAVKAKRLTKHQAMRLPLDIIEKIERLQAITGANKSAVIIYLLNLGLKAADDLNDPHLQGDTEA